MRSPLHYGEVSRVRVYLSISLSPFREKERTQLPDSHENKINRHVNEMCFGCGFVYTGRKSSETYDSTFLFFFSPFCPSMCQRSYFWKHGFLFLIIMLWPKGRWPLHSVSSCCTISVEREGGSWSLYGKPQEDKKRNNLEKQPHEEQSHLSRTPELFAYGSHQKRGLESHDLQGLLILQNFILVWGCSLGVIKFRANFPRGKNDHFLQTTTITNADSVCFMQ